MDIKRRYEDTTEFVKFFDLKVGDVFSFDDYGGFMLKINDKEYFDLEDNEVREYILDYPYLHLVPRKVELHILDNYPADCEEEPVHNTFEFIEEEEDESD